jgi:hypothetical protein
VSATLAANVACHMSADLAYHMAADVCDHVAAEVAVMWMIHVSLFMRPRGPRVRFLLGHVACCE